jgi:hypothetical protein
MQSTPIYLVRPHMFFLGYTMIGLATMWAVLANQGVALVVLAFVALGLAVKKFGKAGVSPVLIVGVGLAVVAVAGWTLYPLVQDAPYASGIRLPASPELMRVGTWGLILASLGVSLGSLIVGALTRPSTQHARLRPVKMRRPLRTFLMFAAAVPTLLLIALRGVDSLIYRSTYLPETSAGGLGGILSLAGIVSMAICGYLLHTQRALGRFIVTSNVIFFTLFIASTGSRRLAAIPALLAFGYYVARMDKFAKRLLFTGLVLAILLVPLPLYWRTLNTHGLIPYWESLPGYFAADLGISTALKTVLISVPIIGATTKARLPDEAISTALDPRTGRTAGWYDISAQMQLNKFTPTAGVGELLHHGTVSLVLLFLAVGIYLAFLDRHIRKLMARGHQLVGFTHIGFVSLFLVYVIQYNLRASMRMLYYSAALLAAYTLWRWAFQPRTAHLHRVPAPRIAVRA